MFSVFSTLSTITEPADSRFDCYLYLIYRFHLKAVNLKLLSEMQPTIIISYCKFYFQRPLLGTEPLYPDPQMSSILGCELWQYHHHGLCTSSRHPTISCHPRREWTSPVSCAFRHLHLLLRARSCMVIHFLYKFFVSNNCLVWWKSLIPPLEKGGYLKVETRVCVCVFFMYSRTMFYIRFFC